MDILCRQAVAGDTPQIILLLKQMHEEMPLLPQDNGKLIFRVGTFVEQGDVLVATHQDFIVGSVGLERVEWWSAYSLHLVARWVYLAGRFRRSKAGHELLKLTRIHAETEGLPLLLDVFAFDQVDRKNRLYRRYFTPVGEKFLSGLEHMKD